MAPAPLLVFHGKSVQAELGNTVHMPECVRKIHLFLAAVRPHRAAKQGAHAGIGLLHQGDQVVRTSYAVLAGQLELAVEGFELITNWYPIVAKQLSVYTAAILPSCQEYIWQFSWRPPCQF